MSALPVDAIVLCAWAQDVCPRVLCPDSVLKYISGIRCTHLESGYPWDLSGHPLVKKTVAALFKRHPRVGVGLKVPLTFDLLLRMVARFPGWPNPASLSWNSLTFVAASSILFFAALRGGEVFTSPSSDRPILCWRDLSIREGGVHISVPKPKTKQREGSQVAFAASTPGGTFSSLEPVACLRSYRSEAARRGFTTNDAGPAFFTKGGAPLTRDFMVKRSADLLDLLGIVTLDASNLPVKVKAASWRCGYVTSALRAKIPEATIRACGRWESQGGMMAYTVSNFSDLRVAAEAIVTSPRQTRAVVVGCSSVEQLIRR